MKETRRMHQVGKFKSGSFWGNGKFPSTVPHCTGHKLSPSNFRGISRELRQCCTDMIPDRPFKVCRQRTTGDSPQSLNDRERFYTSRSYHIPHCINHSENIFPLLLGVSVGTSPLLTYSWFVAAKFDASRVLIFNYFITHSSYDTSSTNWMKKSMKKLTNK